MGISFCESNPLRKLLKTIFHACKKFPCWATAEILAYLDAKDSKLHTSFYEVLLAAHLKQFKNLSSNGLKIKEIWDCGENSIIL